jgi:hypothetical protein
MCLYPDSRAWAAALRTSPGLACHVPRPTAGMVRPLLSLKDRGAYISERLETRWGVLDRGRVWDGHSNTI